MEQEAEMLRANGHIVDTWLPSNDAISGLVGELSTAVGAIFSVPSYLRMRARLRNARPDLVHVHNFFPVVSPSVFYACHRARVPSVLTLHNFRIVCPTAFLMHDGAVTEKSLRRGPWWAVRARVYRGSLFGTLALSTMISAHKAAGTWARQVTRFITLTSFAASKFAEAGLPPSRIVVKPNFVDVPAPPQRDRSGLLFVGRLSYEKGITVLAAAVGLLGVGEVCVSVAGVGPLVGALSDIPEVRALGSLDNASVYNEMAAAQALVMPSLWYEGFPMVLVEAYANGLPVIASRLGALAELVEDGVTGLLFEPGSARDLADKMQWVLDHPDETAMMGRAARERYEARYTPETNYAQLMAIYVDAIAMTKQDGAIRCG